MRRRVSFRLECARARARARALDFAGGVFPRDIAGICQSILRRTNERASELARNSAKLASRLWKLMSCAVHVLVTASPVSSFIFAASRRRMYAVSIIYKRRGDSPDSASAATGRKHRRRLDERAIFHRIGEFVSDRDS